MNQKLDACCTHLKEEIENAEKGLAKLGKHVSSAIGAKTDAIEVHLESAAANLDEKRGAASQAVQRIRDFVEEKTNGALASLEDWKTDREIAKIEKHADKSEQQAVDAIMVAAYAILEAEVAVLEALKARKTAIEVAG